MSLAASHAVHSCVFAEQTNAIVGAAVGVDEGAGDGTIVGSAVGANDGANVGAGVGAVHFLVLSHVPLLQSCPSLHILPALQPSHSDPPQSMSVSAAFFILSVQVDNVGRAVGWSVGAAVGVNVGPAVGDSVTLVHSWSENGATQPFEHQYSLLHAHSYECVAFTNPLANPVPKSPP